MRKEDERRHSRSYEEEIQELKQKHSKEKLAIEQKYEARIRKLVVSMEELKAEQGEATRENTGDLEDQVLFFKSENARLAAELA